MGIQDSAVVCRLYPPLSSAGLSYFLLNAPFFRYTIPVFIAVLDRSHLEDSKNIFFIENTKNVSVILADQKPPFLANFLACQLYTVLGQ